MSEIITHELLKSWQPCTAGFKRFCELFPEGANLKTAVEGLVADGHNGWGEWLFTRCREKGLFGEYVAKGYRNTGDQNTGHRNTGDQNTGHRNTGDQNTGHWNTGDQNTGHRNTGHRNTGHWNTGHWNTGHFNTVTPDTILAFNKACSRQKWEHADKPDFLYFSVTGWVYESAMTDEEKIANPTFFTTGGYLKKYGYQEAFQKAYNAASATDKAKLKKLPNFDADVFFEISGIKVD